MQRNHLTTNQTLLFTLVLMCTGLYLTGCSSNPDDPGGNPPPTNAGTMVVKVLDYHGNPISSAMVNIQGTDVSVDGNGLVTYQAKTVPEYVEVKVHKSGWMFTPDSLKNLIEANDKDTITIRGEQPSDPLFVDMVIVSAGTFIMGSDSTFDRTENSRPTYEATITRAYYIGKFEVTEKLWRAVMGSDSKSTGCDNCPAVGVTYMDAITFCNELSRKKGLEPPYTISGPYVSWNDAADGFRLPTDCEWEFAAKGNLTTAWYRGSYGDWAELNKISWTGDNSGNTKHEVGLLEPNARGMFDVLGNADEWAWDWYADPNSDAKTDYKGPSSGERRILKGASFLTGQGGHFLYKRTGTPPVPTNSILPGAGLRLIRRP